MLTTVVLILSQTTQFHAPHTLSLKYVYIAYFPSIYTWVFQQIFSFQFHHQVIYTSVFFPVFATCSAHLILLGLITRIIFGEEEAPVISGFL